MPLKVSCVASEPTKVSTDYLAIGVFAGALMPRSTLSGFDKALHGAVAKILKREEFKGKKDQAVEIDTLGKISAQRLAIIGLGDSKTFGPAEMRVFAAKAARDANTARSSNIAIVLPEAPDVDRMRAAAEGLMLGAYRFTKYLTGDRMPKATLHKAVIVVPAGTSITAPLRRAADLGCRIAERICTTRDLVNEPANVLSPVELGQFAQDVAKEHRLECRVFDKRELQKRGMNLILAVGQGSAREPRLVHMVYKPPTAAKKRVVVVGKGLTFDSGGLCIKTALGMADMKYDMSGAGNVIGLMTAVSVLQPSIEVHGIIGAAENMPDGAAYRPGDIFRSFDGRSVEIINTDAEGRLVLADALAYARSLKPSLIVSNATLTGACMVALGQRCSGFYATTDELAELLASAAKRAGEQMWRLPLLDDMKDQFKSDVADLKHTGERWAGSVTAALFLREFVGDVPFIHVDIAGPAMAEKPFGFYTKGGTAHGVVTFLELIGAMQND